MKELIKESILPTFVIMIAIFLAIAVLIALISLTQIIYFKWQKFACENTDGQYVRTLADESPTMLCIRDIKKN